MNNPNVVFVNCNEAKEVAEESDEANEALQKINLFWPQVLDEMKRVKSVEPGNQLLPLARIKKIMKLDEDVKMISAEAPLLFAKAAEMFIQELTLRAWVHTEQNKRRTLQRNDIAMAITKYDMFDFLVDIVPRDEIKPKPTVSDNVSVDMSNQPSTSSSAAPSTSTATAPASSVVIVKDNPTNENKPAVAMVNDQLQYYIQLAQQQHQQQQQQQQATTIVNTGNMTNQLSQMAQQSNLGSNIILAGPNIIQQQPQVMTLGAANQMQLIQLPSGEVAQIPIQLNQQQIQQICRQMQMQQQPQQQPIIIQQPTMQPTIIQSPGNNIYLTQQQLQQLQNQHNQQAQIQLQNPTKQE